MRIFLIIVLSTFNFVCLYGQENAVWFNEAYIKLNDNKVNIEIPEIQELTLIMMAITDHGLKDSNMVNHKNSYHQEVLSHFSKFKDHEAIKICDSLLQKSLIYYILISSNSYGFQFDGDSLIRTCNPPYFRTGIQASFQI